MSRGSVFEDVLTFWFGPEPLETRAVWFQKDPEFDAQIKDKFGAVFDEAAAGELDGLARASLGCLALVIILDQFPRNMYRDDARAYATDEKALGLSKAAIESGFDHGMTVLQRQFLYMPYQHSEVLEDQRRSVELFASIDANTHEYAVRHLEVIERFGRFPHRNAVLGRESTEAEMTFLTEPNSSF